MNGTLVKTPIAAQAVGLSASYLFRNAKRIPASRRAGKALRWDVSELRDWMAAQAHAKPDAEAVAR
ncbi:MAG TPA: hypothetical protein VGQ08_13255 [Nitrospiraceae bacterium]|nr:hypothetical protein [Nitrospiraceae bacterium]